MGPCRSFACRSSRPPHWMDCWSDDASGRKVKTHLSTCCTWQCEKGRQGERRKSDEQTSQTQDWPIFNSRCLHRRCTSSQGVSVTGTDSHATTLSRVSTPLPFSIAFFINYREQVEQSTRQTHRDVVKLSCQASQGTIRFKSIDLWVGIHRRSFS